MGVLRHGRAALQLRGVSYYAMEAAAGPPLYLRDGVCPQGASADPQRQARGPEGCNDARTGMPARILAGAMCVQRFDDSLNSAIHITYRISLRSSSMPEPRDPLLKVLIYLLVYSEKHYKNRVRGPLAGAARCYRAVCSRRSNVLGMFTGLMSCITR